LPIAYPGAPYGWRARIGLLQPTMVSDNNPFEFYLMAPPGVQMVLTSLGLTDGPNRDDQYKKAMENLDVPIRRVMERNVQAIVQSGVPPIVTRGWGYEDEVLAKVRAVTDIPYATDIGSCIAAMQALKVTKIATLASTSMQNGLAEYLEHAGIETITSSSKTLESADTGGESYAPPYRSVVNVARMAPGCQAVFVPGANRPIVGVIEALEEEIGVPIVSSAQALFWRGLQLAGVNPKLVTGFGKLFQAD
jgi:maleate cis-trans isomerase